MKVLENDFKRTAWTGIFKVTPVYVFLIQAQFNVKLSSHKFKFLFLTGVHL